MSEMSCRPLSVVGDSGCGRQLEAPRRYATGDLAIYLLELRSDPLNADYEAQKQGSASRLTKHGLYFDTSALPISSDLALDIVVHA